LIVLAHREEESLKKRFLIFSALAAVFISSHAGLKAEVSTRVDLASRYIWRGFDLNPHKKPVIQPSVDFAFGKCGLSLNLWSSFSFVSRDLNEFDLALTFCKKISEDVSFSAGLIHYAWYFSENFSFKDDTSHEIFLSLGLPNFFLTPSLSFFYDFTNGDGIYALLEIGYSFPLFKNLNPDLSASLGYNGGQWLAEGVDPGFSDLNFGLSLPFDIGRFQFSAFVNYTVVLLDAIGEENHFWFGFSLSVFGKRGSE
jgi:uncharacterized protein (TIGR02001 family)